MHIAARTRQSERGCVSSPVRVPNLTRGGEDVREEVAGKMEIESY